MSQNVVAVREDVPLSTIARIFTESEFGAVPVVDANEKPTGIVTKSDVVRALADGNGDNRAGHYTLTTLHSLPEDAPIWEAAAVMSAWHMHHMLVMDDVGKLAGVVSTLDVVRWLARKEGWEVG